MNSSQSNQSMCDTARRCWYIAGATAGGKTAIGIELAKRIGAEIISLDSMAIYRGMDIGTAKPSAEQMVTVPHHMVDIADPIDEFSVTQYRQQATEIIAQIEERDKQVIFVGGSALYLKALLRGLFDGPPANWEFREAIEAELKTVGIESLHRRLAQVDPISAQRLHVNDKRRIIRALEVYTTTGTPISHVQDEHEIAVPQDQCRVFTIRHPRSVLHDRIAARVERMFESGFVAEVDGLLKRWGQLGRTASQAVGYREVIDYLQTTSSPEQEDPGHREGGGSALDRVKEKVLYRTRQFARHQETWFRGLDECRILDMIPADESAVDVEQSAGFVDSTVETIIQIGQEID